MRFRKRNRPSFVRLLERRESKQVSLLGKTQGHAAVDLYVTPHQEHALNTCTCSSGIFSPQSSPAVGPCPLMMYCRLSRSSIYKHVARAHTRMYEESFLAEMYRLLYKSNAVSREKRNPLFLEGVRRTHSNLNPCPIN